MIEKMKDEDYFKYDALSNSTLKLFRVAPEKIGTVKSSDAMTKGSLWHAVLLDQPLDDYIIEKKIDGRSKEGKEQKARIEESGKILVDPDELLEIDTAQTEMSRTLLDCKLLEAFQDAEKEVAIVQEIDGIKCKGKFDAINVKENIIFDVKTISDIEKIPYNLKAYKYNLQADFYCRLAKLETWRDYDFYFVFVETQNPYLCEVVKLNEVSMQYAFEGNENAIAEYKKWIQSGKPRKKREVKVI
jgi:hypothetical protein